jgi:hypothetical protein
MRTHKEKIMVGDNDTWFMVLVAIRYCIGRRSYAPSLATEWVKRYWNLIPLTTQAMLLRDVSEEVQRGETNTTWLGDDCDKATWINFEKWMRERIQREHK